MPEFEIRRRSNIDPEDRPCEEAFRKDDKWFVEIDTLDKLLSFLPKYGDLVIYTHKGIFGESEVFGKDPVLVIYDSWLE